MTIRARPVTLAFVPAALGLIVGVVFLLVAGGVAVRFTVPIGVLAATVGVLVSAVVLLALFARERDRRAREQARAGGLREQRESHRKFLARLDHELKNPLTAIRAAVAAEGSIADAGLSPHQAVIESQTRRLGSLVTDLRKLADLETTQIEYEPVDLESLAADVVDVVREECRASPGGDRAITVTFPRVPWPMPTVRGDVDLLFLAVYNLVSNAVKYSGPDATIEVRGIEDDGWAVIEVADTGIGIPADDVEFVCDELARGRNARGTPGSGLGLSLTTAVASRHGGSVSVKSREGQGTSVRLRVPVSR